MIAICFFFLLKNTSVCQAAWTKSALLNIMAKSGGKGVNLKDKLEGNELDLSLCDLNEVPVKELVGICFLMDSNTCQVIIGIYAVSVNGSSKILNTHWL